MLGNQYLEPLIPCNKSLCEILLSLDIVTVTGCYKIGETNADGRVLIYTDKNGKKCFKSKKYQVLSSVGDSLFLLNFRIPTASVKNEKLSALIGTSCMLKDYVTFNGYFFVEACKVELFCEAIMGKVNRGGNRFYNRLSNRQNRPMNFPMSSIAMYGKFVLSRIVNGLWDPMFKEKLFLEYLSGLPVEFIVREKKRKKCCCCCVRSRRRSDLSLEEYQSAGNTVLSDVSISGVKTNSHSVGKIQ
ncbi:DUF3023 domain-containing protein [Ehrlichia canis]|uniref:DUF3023 domain-containing protein n=1 Tax=Ehrlichia canis TaxID=944 RepID=UPI001F250C70|nr:DUF3023 domain-containing protein [Ehrlichia canis]UKC53473.1 DUF3023 domain-containing protein [Ehrlichia canis]UKC54411.1 DUF3023 domain-containing protein [Ehrlichia canis]UKC55348.1 DUF3023 domain-containing protein [Ehrlichia canis]